MAAAKQPRRLAAALEAHATPKALGIIDTALRDLPPEATYSSSGLDSLKTHWVRYPSTMDKDWP